MGFLLIQIISRSLRNFSEVVFQQFFPTTFRNGLILVPLFSFIWSHNLGFIIFTALLSVKTDKLDLDIYIWLGMAMLKCTLGCFKHYLVFHV